MVKLIDEQYIEQILVEMFNNLNTGKPSTYYDDFFSLHYANLVAKS